MFDFEQNNYSNRTNETLHRVRRHISFVNLWNESICYYPAARNPTSDEMCQFLQTHSSCSYFVHYVDYLKLLFCTLHLTWSPFYVLIVVLIFTVVYTLIYLLAKYFCVPNYIMLMKLLPISPYAFSFAYYSFCIFLPDYLGFWLHCPFTTAYEASLTLSKFMGDILRFFVIGIMMLCISGQRIYSVLWWNNMAFILVGYIYLFWIVSYKYEMFDSPNLAYDDAHLMRFNAWTFLYILVLVLFLAVFISFHKLRRPRTASQIIKDTYRNTELPSEADIDTGPPASEGLTKFQIWWRAVNGYAIMKERYKFIVIIFTPFYFVLANVIPVMDKKRPFMGWCKPIVCMGFLIIPLLFIDVNPDPTSFCGLLVCSWLVTFFVCISFDSLREPNALWIGIFSVVGTLVSSICLQILFSELDNLMWQYCMMQFGSSPDLICVLFFSTGECFCTMVVVTYLKRANLFNAAYGVVMNLVTHAVYTALPLLTLHNCYNKNIFVMCTADTETSYTFFLVIFFSTLFHVSMSGNEFRMSLFLYLVLLYVIYYTYQILNLFEVVQPFGSLHIIRPPWRVHNQWA